MLREYRVEWLRNDVPAGLSVAAVALPVAIAYAQLAGFPPHYEIDVNREFIALGVCNVAAATIAAKHVSSPGERS